MVCGRNLGWTSNKSLCVPLICRTSELVWVSYSLKCIGWDRTALWGTLWCLQHALLPHQEMGLGSIERCKGFSAHLMKVLICQRRSLTTLTEQWILLRYWPSTWVCGQKGQVNSKLLQRGLWIIKGYLRPKEAGGDSLHFAFSDPVSGTLEVVFWTETWTLFACVWLSPGFGLRPFHGSSMRLRAWAVLTGLGHLGL